MFPLTPDPWKVPGIAVGTGNVGAGVGKFPGAYVLPGAEKKMFLDSKIFNFIKQYKSFKYFLF